MTEISSDIRMFNELYREYKARFVFFAKMYVMSLWRKISLWIAFCIIGRIKRI